MPHHRYLFVAFSIVLAITGFSIAQSRERDLAKEQPLYQELKTVSPTSVAAFQAATVAMDTADFELCISKFNEVLAKAPNFDPAMRRQGHCLIGAGKRDDGYKAIQKAIDLNRSADNLFSMAMARLDPGSTNYVPPEGEMQKALALTTEASKLYGDKDVDALLVMADLSLRLNQLEQFRTTVGRLKTLSPNDPYTHYFNAIKLAEERNFDESLAEVKVAESLGLDASEAEKITAGVKAMRDEAYPLAPYLIYIYAFIAIVVAWAIGLLLLYFFGRTLSTKTLSTIESSAPDDVTGGGHSSLKHTYRRLILFASVYYYISQPVLVALIIAVTGGLIVGSFMVGTIPVGFLIGLVFVGAGSIFYMFKSLIIRPKVEDPGRLLEREEAPQLWDLVEKVAVDINTRPVDEIRITPGVEIAVYERGGFREKMQDKGERVLILGAGSFNDFSTNGFRAVLAHEYGHLSNRDTAGGDVAFRVNSDMMRLAEAIVNSGNNTYHNLAFHFLRLYNFIFRRITHGASRLQEVLADRVAVNTYGAYAFTSGLGHVVRQGVIFQKLADSEISSALAGSRKFNNIYDLKAENDADITEIDDLIKVEFERQTTDDDTHPATADRIRLAEKIAGQNHEDLSGMVWDLFVDREKFTAEMNILVEKQIRGERYSNYHDIGFSEVG